MLDPTIIAIPLYFSLIGLELLYVHFTKNKLYRFKDAITNINAGATQQIVAVLMSLVGISLYAVVYEWFSLKLIDTSQWYWHTFLLLFVLWDLCYYWAHRLSHEINLFWSAHVVHHQSEYYNLSVALRQSWFQGVWTAPVYLPLAIIGFDPQQVVFVAGINLIYQFWIHTETINKMGWLEWIMNTPSHHRVHHGRNPKYIDKNHAGVFIIWDRLFGTFQKEEERPVYGITTPIKSWNPIYANFAHFKVIGQQFREASSLKAKLQVLFKKPGWSAKSRAYLAVPEVDRSSYVPYDNPIPRGLSVYVTVQYVLLLGTIALFLFQQASLPGNVKWFFAAIVMLSVWTMSGLLEMKRPLYWLEYVRLPLTFGIYIYFLDGTFSQLMYGLPFMFLTVGSWYWLFRFFRAYQGLSGNKLVKPVKH
ncbi:MAG TPA: sterol desaturase family protein [Cytophagales bacterium]|jgi:alkylglycerol monooxygenase|nr:sterol desaturase family protein [Cytophagales bacterium]